MKTPNQKAWWLVVPVVLLVAFNALIPLMTVINYSVQETFGENVFFFEGVKWFQAVLHSERFHNSLQRQLLFTGIILAIEVPLGVAIALAMPRRGPWVSVCLVLVAAHSAKTTVQLIGESDPRRAAHGYGWPGALAPGLRRRTPG